MLHSLFDLLFPPRSLRGRAGDWITNEERNDLRSFPLIVHASTLRGRHLASLDRIVSASRYAGNPLLRRAIQTYKYGRVPFLRKDLGMLLASVSRFCCEEREEETLPLLCPVPLHWTRRFQRGFDQAEELAAAVSTARGWQMRRLLVRKWPTGHQAHRRRAERRGAMTGAFRIRRGALPIPPFIIIVDDVATTGATLDACAGVLKEAGAKRVEGLVLAV